ncbi:MAG: hypothetical protein IJ735_05830 [Clostridia bacterium]|nr:hypothetical protein [Clostridia bacterium]
MSRKWKNAVGVLLIIVVVAAVVAGVTVAVLDNNKKKTEVEYFVDVAPTDYTADENVVYVKRFRDTVENLFSFLSEELKLKTFADRVLNAASLARIPAEKLDGVATAIKKVDLASIGSDLVNIDEEKIRRFAERSTLSVMQGAVSDLFSYSGLSTGEFAAFLYEYLALYGTETYKATLAVLGKETFVDFVGATLFVVTETGKMGTGIVSHGQAIQAAAYEYGSIVKDAYAVGDDVFSEAFGLRFNRMEGSEDSVAFMNEKTGPLFCLMGYLFSEISFSTAENLAEKNFSSDNVSAYVALAKDILRGADAFLSDYGERMGAGDYDELAAVIIEYYDRLNRARYLSLSVDLSADQMREYLEERRAGTTKFFSALRALGTEGDYTEEERAAQVADFSAFSEELNELGEAFIYLWFAERAGELDEEAQ